MATTNTTNGVQLQVATQYLRVFYFGTTAQTVVVNRSQNGGTFNAASASPATEIANGWYKILLSTVDTNTPGDLAFHCTAGAGGPAEWNDQVVSQVFTQLALNTSGQVLVASPTKQNQSLLLPFTMTSTSSGAPLAGLLGSITATRNFGSGFSACTNTPTELGNGDYAILLAAADTNSPSAIYRFIASPANDVNIVMTFQP